MWLARVCAHVFVCVCVYVRAFCEVYVRQIEIGLQLKNLIYGYFNDGDVVGNNDVASCVSTCERVYFALDLNRLVCDVDNDF